MRRPSRTPTSSRARQATGSRRTSRTGFNDGSELRVEPKAEPRVEPCRHPRRGHRDVSGPILFLIPARGGSTRVPGKNLRTIAGIPLVGHAVRNARIAAARVPGGPHRVGCSTDDAGIAEAARAWGGEGVDRPAELATATGTSFGVR